CALALALLKAGSSIAANIAMIAITTSNSIRVNPARKCRRLAILRILNRSPGNRDLQVIKTDDTPPENMACVSPGPIDKARAHMPSCHCHSRDSANLFGKRSKRSHYALHSPRRLTSPAPWAARKEEAVNE